MDAIGVREVTDAEVAFYREHGWVALPNLVDAAVTGALLARAKELMGDDASAHVAREGIDSATNPWQDRHNIIEDDSLFAEVGLSAAMGRNAQRLMRRDVGVLLYNNTLAVKIGAEQSASIPASDPTGFHQDGAGYPMDRTGVVSFWISLDHNTPEMGTVRYLDRSHHCGPLGNMNRGGHIQGSLFEVYPELSTLQLMDPPELQPGDAAAHDMFTLHDAPANHGARPRWAFLIRYIPSDTVYTGAVTNSQATLRKIQNAQLVAGETFEGPLYPRVYG